MDGWMDEINGRMILLLLLLLLLLLQAIARHVMGVHINASGSGTSRSGDATSSKSSSVEGEVSLTTMTKYIAYCRTKCAPRLSACLPA